MTDTCMVYRPGLVRRIWRALGFRQAYQPDPWEEPVDGMAEGSMLTVTHARLDWKDRLRVLVSGHIMVAVRTKTDVPVARAMSASTVTVVAPGDT